MPTPITTERSAFQERLVLFLAPFFAAVSSDYEAIRTEILETIASYGARTRAEMVAAARIIAFSFSSLDMLAEAKSADLPPALQLRFHACANSLNRVCQQDEKALAKRLACDRPGVAAPKAKLAAEPVDDLSDEQVESALQQAHTQITSYSNRLSGPPGAQQRPWVSPMMAALADELSAKSGR